MFASVFVLHSNNCLAFTNDLFVNFLKRKFLRLSQIFNGCLPPPLAVFNVFSHRFESLVLQFRVLEFGFSNFKSYSRHTRSINFISLILYLLTFSAIANFLTSIIFVWYGLYLLNVLYLFQHFAIEFEIERLHFLRRCMTRVRFPLLSLFFWKLLEGK